MTKAYVRFPDFKRKAVTLSYDDGPRQDKRLIEIMKKHGLKGTFNLNSGCFAKEYCGVEKGAMTVKEALDLYLPSGMEVAIHGYKHMSLPKVDFAMATNDICQDRKELERIFGRIINGMAYANGAYSDEIVEMLKANGVKYARTVISTESFNLPTDWLRLPTTCHHKNPRLMELARSFVEQEEHPYFWRNAPIMFYLWGHSYEFDNNDNWNVIEEFAEYIGGREDVWYATNSEIFNYLEASDRLEFSMDATRIHNPTATKIWLDLFGKKLTVSPGETVVL